MDLLILDADGVFMNEMPYWKTALAAALTWHGLSVRSADCWDALAGVCFRDLRVQVITKGRGCNSNWDLTAVMVRALDRDADRAAVSSALSACDWQSAARGLGQSMERLWRHDSDIAESFPQPPLAGFGIDRHSEFFKRIVTGYQDVFLDRSNIDWPFPRHELAIPRDRLRATLTALRNSGFTLGVCTSRDRWETVPPMTELGVIDLFDPARIVTHDQTLEAQHRIGVRPLQKPHGFPLLCAMAGFDAAVEAVRTGVAPGGAVGDGRRIFAGDTPADFETALACHRIGLPVEYLHIDSGLTDTATLTRITRHRCTLGLASDLPSAVPLLGGRAS